MPIKKLLYRCQPAQLHIVLVLSICYFVVQLIYSHVTHALTLLMASYHMLCNIFALTGCIMAIKQSKTSVSSKGSGHNDSNCGESNEVIDDPNGPVGGSGHEIVISLGPPSTVAKTTAAGEEQSLARRERREMKLRNTFGWTRIDVLTMLIVCVFLASLSFSLLVEALQTLVHIDHQDTMHLPVSVMILGLIGLILNGLTYLLIGGYTMHQGSFLHVTPSGNVVLDRAIPDGRMTPIDDTALKADERQLSRMRNDQQQQQQQEPDAGTLRPTNRRQGAVEMLRDISSTMFVIVCAFIVYLAEDEEHTAKFIDPILAIFSCVLLVSLSYPYMKESCLILLQTIPDSINMETFERTLVQRFPQIVSYHDFHIWQLTTQRSIATVHIKFQSPQMYAKIIDEIRTYFHEQGITEVTIQPEFHCAKVTPSLECLVQCSAADCVEKVCCKDSRSDLREVGKSTSNVELSFVKETPSLDKNTKMIRPVSMELNCTHGHVDQKQTKKSMDKQNHSQETVVEENKIAKVVPRNEPEICDNTAQVNNKEINCETQHKLADDPSH